MNYGGLFATSSVFLQLCRKRETMDKKEINVGDNIKKFRELKNITREKMAADLEMTVSGYSKIERNEVDLTLSRIYLIAQIIGVDISQILNFDASQIFGPYDSQNYSGVNLFNTATAQYDRSADFYRGYFQDYFEALNKERKEVKKFPVRK